VVEAARFPGVALAEPALADALLGRPRLGVGWKCIIECTLKSLDMYICTLICRLLYIYVCIRTLGISSSSSSGSVDASSSSVALSAAAAFLLLRPGPAFRLPFLEEEAETHTTYVPNNALQP